MSAIASACKIDISPLAAAVHLLDRSEYTQFLKFMDPYMMCTLPYSGYVLGAVVAFAGTQGVRLPEGRDISVLSGAHRKTMGLIAFGKAADYASAAKGLAQLQATDAELHQYYNELYDHDWDEAAMAMREGFAFLERAIRAVESSDDLLLIMVTT